MEFSSSILPKEGSYYTLQDATIADGILHIAPGGSLSYQIVQTDIANLTEYFRVAVIIDEPADRYEPEVRINLQLRTIDDVYYNVAVFPTTANEGVFMQEVQLQAGGYKSFSFEITSQREVSIALWELSPQASETDIEVIIEGVKQSLPRLLYDYNTKPLYVGQRETVVAMIAYNLLDATDLQGHLQLSYVAPEACSLTIRFKDSGATELFCPITYDLKPGRGSIGVPHAYLNRLVGVHDLRVTAQVTAGELMIETRGLLFTIDGGYLAERLIDVGGHVYDLSVKQTRTAESPQELWIIGLEEEKTLVRKRPYSSNTSITFDPVYELPRAISGAIEFAGEWSLRGGAQNFTLITEDWPWLFWVEPNGDLYTQHGQDVDTRYLLDTNTTYVSVCMGYKSTEFVEQDQGLVCAYIKDGILYYRSYGYDANVKTVLWQPPVVIHSEAPVYHVHVHRLNDFRLGVAFTTEENNYWYLTERTYVNQGISPETISVKHNTQLLNFRVCEAAQEPNLTYSNSISDDGLTATVTFNYELLYNPEFGEAFTWLQNLDESQIKSVQVQGNQIIFNFNTPKRASFKIGTTGITLRYIVPNVGTYAISDLQFYWEIKQRVGYQDILSVSQVSSSLNASVKPILTKSVTDVETIAIEATQVDMGLQVNYVGIPITAQNEDLVAISCVETLLNIQLSQIGTDPI